MIGFIKLYKDVCPRRESNPLHPDSNPAFFADELRGRALRVIAEVARFELARAAEGYAALEGAPFPFVSAAAQGRCIRPLCHTSAITLNS